MMVWFSPGQDGGHGQGHLDPDQHLPVGGAEGLGRFHQLGVHLADAQTGQADQGRQGEDNGRQNTGHIADRKEHDDGHQVDKGRCGLHGIQHGPESGLEVVTAAGPDAERNTHQGAEE